MFFGLRKPALANLIDTIPVPGSVGCMGLVACPGTRIDKIATGNDFYKLTLTRSPNGGPTAFYASLNRMSSN
jgi:hypothetical protein